MTKLLKLSNFFIEMGQSIAVVYSPDLKNNDDILTYKENLLKTYVAICIDFNGIGSIGLLAQKIIQECKRILEQQKIVENISIIEPDYSDDYYCLDYALKKLDEISIYLDTDILFICHDFTHILSFDKDRRIESHMRSAIQHFQNLVLLFTSHDEEKINKIFLDPKAPFFRFVRIVKPFVD